MSKNNARAAAKAAAAALEKGGATVGSSEGENGGPAVSGETSVGATNPAPTVITPPVVADTTSPSGKAREKRAIFEDINTVERLRKAMWTQNGGVYTMIKSNGSEHRVEVVKASIVNILSAMPLNNPAPWLFTQRIPGDIKSGCLLTDPASLPSAVAPAAVAPTTESSTTPAEEVQKEGEETTAT